MPTTIKACAELAPGPHSRGSLLRRMGCSLAHAFPNLTAVNPYIVGSLQPAAAAGKGLRAHMPRQALGAAQAGLWGQAVGASGFAFQGTNAHVVLGWCAWAAPARQCYPHSACLPAKATERGLPSQILLRPTRPWSAGGQGASRAR